MNNKYIQAKQQLENAINFLEPYIQFTDSHVVDFFTKSLYTKCIPKEIQEEIKKNGTKETVDLLLNSKINGSTPCLNEYVQKCKSYSLYNYKNICLPITNFKEKLKQLGSQNYKGIKLDVFMSEKKSHEVEILSSVIASLKYITNSTHIVDVGDGKGYLSSMLAFYFKMPVLGIDCSSTNTNGAMIRAEKLQRAWNGIMKNKYKKEEDSNMSVLYKQITYYISENIDLKKIAQDIFKREELTLGLVGLHTCGNLGPTSIKLYNNNKNIKMLCNVSCCYHLLEKDECSDNEFVGFPMSSFLINKQYSLSRPARMLTAQSIDRIFHRKIMPKKTVFYRAIFQVIINNYCIEFPEKNVGRTKKQVNNFVDYARRALVKTNADMKISDSDLISLFKLYEHRESEIDIFNLMRYMLAPVIESIILLDRLLYLYEQRHENSFIVQFFDPVISPRCYGVVSIKI